MGYCGEEIEVLPRTERGGGMSGSTCQGCGVVHLAQFHCPEKIWRFLGLGDDDILCAECTQRRATERGITLGWFINDENYLSDPDWQPMDSLRAQLAALRAVVEEARAAVVGHEFSGHIDDCAACDVADILDRGMKGAGDTDLL